MKRGMCAGIRGTLPALAAVAAGAALLPAGTKVRADAALAAGCAPPVASAAAAGTLADDEALRARVQTALHADPFFYDAHVTVTVDKGNVALRGFVLSEWDLQSGLRIAREAAPGRRVINDLSIKLGGAR